MTMIAIRLITIKERTMIKLAYRSLVSMFLLFLFLATPSLAAETSFEKPAFGSGKATITFSGSPLKTMTETPFSLTLVDSDGQAISDAEIAIDMDMPAMPMPPNKPQGIWKDNAYQGVAIFTMAGAWHVNVTIKRPGQEQEKIVFEIDRVMMK